MPRFNRRPLNRHHCLDRQVPLLTEILHVTKISGLRGAPVDREEVCYKVSHSFCTSAILFGVPSDAVLPFCTWERPLVYQVIPCCCFVQGNALWCTKRCRAAVLYSNVACGVPSDAARLFCTWERPVVYQAMPCCRFVQERGLWCTDLISCRMRCGDFVRKDEYLCVCKKRTLMI